MQVAAAVLVGKPSFWLVFIFAMFTWPIARSLQAGSDMASRDAAGPVLGTVRPFTLEDPAGGSFGTAQLRGRLWLASFTATDCGSPCGRAERSMARLEELRHRTRNLGDAFRIVTFPIDPERSTAAHMKELSEAHRARRGPWRFSFGSPPRLRDVLADFQVVKGTPDTYAALVDPELRIRSYYDLADEPALARLLRDISALLSRNASPEPSPPP